MVSLKRLGLLLWYGLGLYLVLLDLQGAVIPWVPKVRAAAGAANVLGLVEALLGLAVIAGAFVLLHLAARALPSAAEAWSGRAARPAAAPAPAPRGEAFPSPATLAVGVWLLVIAALDVLALFAVIEPPTWLMHRFPAINPDPHQPGMVQDMLVTMFAAGIGGSVSIMLGYLEHASIKKDFDVSFVPWYVARPIMGMLTGVIFYFVLKGGLLATAPGMSRGANLDDLSLAGFGALVGLFSKNALEKLRELFSTLFATQGSVVSEVKSRVPADLWSQIAPYLSAAKGEGGDDEGSAAGEEGAGAPPAPGPPTGAE